MSTIWTPTSWKKYPALQQPAWDDQDKLNKILSILDKRLPLVFSGEVEKLKSKLAAAARGEMFLLQGGDCAERFEPELEDIENKLKILLQMNMVLMYAASKPVIKIGRFAGQFAKPRSKPTQEVNGQTLPSYFGDIVNRPESTAKARLLNPKNMLDAYNFSASTLNIIRSLTNGGFADLHQVHIWNKEFLSNSPAGKHYEEIADGISRALEFMTACGITSPQTSTTDFYTSHEALVLDYETPLTRQDPENGKWYDLSAHMLWIGERTRDPEGAHVEYMRGINNPIGIKIGPTAEIDQLRKLLDKLNPENEEGRINLITRFGCNKITDLLPPIVEQLSADGRNILWSCDPMHANTQSTPNGYKTRAFTDILAELKHFLAIHKTSGTVGGGVHLELTGEHVTECTGGAEKLTEKCLEENYKTACDPRLNAKQAVEMAFLIAKEIS